MSATDPDRDPALPAFVGTWSRAYVLVLGVLAADIALLWLLSGTFS